MVLCWIAPRDQSVASVGLPNTVSLPSPGSRARCNQLVHMIRVAGFKPNFLGPCPNGLADERKTTAPDQRVFWGPFWKREWRLAHQSHFSDTKLWPTHPSACSKSRWRNVFRFLAFVLPLRCDQSTCAERTAMATSKHKTKKMYNK
jgi:hypothetical protein